MHDRASAGKADQSMFLVKREGEILAVLEATSGMYGDLQGIAGQNLKDIDALEGPMHLELGK